MRRFALIVVFFLVACSSDPVPVLPTMTVPAKPPVVALPTLLDQPQRWIGRPLVLIAPVAVTASAVTLVAGFHSDGQQLRPFDTASTPVWLSGTVPDSVKVQLPGGLGYLKLRGQLAPPGAYGPDARYPFQFMLTGSDALQPDTTTLVNLTTNIHALNDVLLKITGVLLTTKADTLLTEHTGPGGVPQNDSRQIKVRGPPPSEVVQQLAGSGDVRYGPVTVIGWWHDNTLLPFVIQPAP